MFKYYVYRHIRLDKNEPFYIGVGTKPHRYTTHKSEYLRAYQINKTGRGEIWERIVFKVKYDVEIFYESNNYEEVLNKEIELIVLYGRINIQTGTLANMTNGGIGAAGYKHSGESRIKMSQSRQGRKFSKEVIEKRSRTRKENGYKVSDNQKKIMSEKMKGNKNSLGTKKSTEERLRISIRIKKSLVTRDDWEQRFGRFRNKPIECLSLDGVVLFSFKSLKEAGEVLRKDTSAIWENIKGVSKFAYLYYNNKKIKVKWQRRLQ